MKTEKLSRRSFLKSTAALSAGVLGTSLLAACGPSSTSDATGAESGSAPSSAVTEVRIQTPGIPSLETTTNWAVDQFNESQGDILAISETIPYNEIVKKTDVGFVSGTLQDLNYGHNKWYKFNSYRGIYLPVDELIESSPPEDFEDFFPFAVEGLRWEGQLYCLPDIIKPGPVSILYWNKQLLEEAGVEEPTDDWTMLDLEEAARKVADPDNGVFGFDAPFDSDLHRLACITRAFGEPTLEDKRGWPVNEEGTEFRLLEPLVSDVLQWLLAMSNDRVIPRSADSIEGGLFAAGKLAFEIQAVGFAVQYQEMIDDRFEWGYGLMPVGPEGRRGSCNEGNQWMINSKSEVVDAAWEVMKHLTSKETNKWGALNTIKIPSRISAYLDEEVNAKVPTYGISVPVMEEWLEPFPMVDNLRYNEVFQTYQQEIAFLTEGEETWDSYAQTIYDKVQAIIDEPRPPKAG